MTDLKERYIATVVGTACGDSLGIPFEPWKREQIQKYVGRVTTLMEPFVVLDEKGNKVTSDEFGKLKYWGLGKKKGQWSDDTILTLAIAESLVECAGMNLEDIARTHLAAFETEPKAGYGYTTRDALKRLQEGISPWKSGVIGGPGNAPAMKMAPVGLYMHATGQYEEGLQFAEHIGRMTHLDPRSIVSGIVQAHAAYNALRDVPRHDFIDSLRDVCQNHEQPVTPAFPLHEAGSMMERLEWISEHRNESNDAAHEHLGSSSEVFASHPFALFMFQKYWDDPLEGLIETVNYGGDCDTTGAIYGALAGAKNGMIFPQEWLDVLNQQERLVSAGRRLYELREIG